MGIFRMCWSLRNAVVVIVTPLLLLPLLMQGTTQSAAGFCLLLMAVYWATEAFPIAVTALLPVMLFPMTGIMTGKDVSKTYINDSSMLFVGGLIMAVAIEEWNIHKRIALRLLLAIGTKPTRLMLGLMLPSWFLSMWTSNMATTAMMCPIADALLKELRHSRDDTSQEQECLVKCGTAHAYGAMATSGDAMLLEKSQDNTDMSSANMEITVSRTDEGRHGDTTKADPPPSREHRQLAKAMTISIAYAANVGGTTTITGCASNIILKGLADEIFSEVGLNSGISFGSWLVLAFPVSLMIFVVLFLWLQLYFRGCKCLRSADSSDRNIKVYIQREYNRLGTVKSTCSCQGAAVSCTSFCKCMSQDNCNNPHKKSDETDPDIEYEFPEITVIILFVVLILLWVTRDLGGVGGWGNIFKSKYVTDSAAPTFVATLLFLIPSNLPDLLRKGNAHVSVTTLLTWRAVQDKLPWGLFILFGGGFALAEGCQVSGLATSIRDALTVFKDLPVWLTSFLVAMLVSLVTEVATNTATCTLVLPIIAQLALGIGVNPLYLMIPTAVATSYAFMLPVATPPNAMVYVLGHFTIGEMIRVGFVMNVVSVLILTLGVNTWGAEYFDLRTLPREFVNPNISIPGLST